MKLQTAKVPAVDVMFRAFSDRTRLRLLNLLQGGEGRERCVCELVEALELPQSKISRHLAYLRKAGLVKARKEGLWMYYRLAPAGNEFHESLLKCLTCCFGSVPELRGDLRRIGEVGCGPTGEGCC